jgi:hypothetical protein
MMFAVSCTAQMAWQSCRFPIQCSWKSVDRKLGLEFFRPSVEQGSLRFNTEQSLD